MALSPHVILAIEGVVPYPTRPKWAPVGPSDPGRPSHELALG